MNLDRADDRGSKLGHGYVPGNHSQDDFDGLTHYQMTNFRLFDENGRKLSIQVEIHCGKRRNCSLRAISLFPTVFSKGLSPRCVKRCHCVGMG